MNTTLLAESLFKKEKKGPVLENFLSMGVVNCTPDSFSDGKIDLSQKDLSHRIQDMIDQGSDIIDIGAQSTAPGREAFTLDIELQRWKDIALPSLASKIEQIKTLSVDTYQPEVFRFVYKSVKDLNPNIKIIWNDVSGCLDEAVLNILQEYSDAFYVYTHNLAPQRELVNKHMDFVNQTPSVEMAKEIMNFFKDVEIRLAKYNLVDRTYFDPGFGFSKNLEQNLILLRELWWVIKKFDYEKKWLIGISRKSFLQSIVKENLSCKSDVFPYTEKMEHTLIYNWMYQLNKYCLTFRTHNPHHLPLAKGIYKKVNLQ
ncbi:MAG: dihydropteroate synthase [Bdellovibrionales bacterium]|jgi:dihydropteroate synthase|nr:dihydropteroate synthase [Bdellovibrionales bacterium]